MTQAAETSPQEQVRLYQNRVEKALDRWLPNPEIHPARLHRAMRYAVLNGGKRVRPVLMYAAGAALGADPAHLDAPACAVELIHAYSLVHDDLPAMDDDDLRRGQPTCHKAFDEATALLAGDALQALAFDVLARDPDLPVAAPVRVAMLAELAHAAGSRGMAGGQAIDLAAVGQTLDQAQLEDMHIHKTGALIRASVRLGSAGAAQASPDAKARLDRYAKCIGLAFQIQDDILDVEGDAERLGKRTGADDALDKPTYPAILGLSGAKQLAQDLRADALEQLVPFDERAGVLRWLADYIVARDR